MNSIWRLLALLISAVVITSSVSVVQAKFPEKPVTIVAYMKPGGAADVDSRKFSLIAERLTGGKFVVRNKTGAGGLVAMKHVLSQPADGYLLMATTKSQIYKIVTAKSNVKVEDFEWLAMNQSDPEAIITNSELSVNTWQQLLADAKAKAAAGKRQIWVGPAAGGLDHVMAMKTWKAAGITSAKYIPFKGGKKAIIELLGGRSVAYVGNPRDTIGRPKLRIAALARVERLPAFPNAPTFRELGIKGLDHEIMWRGFAMKSGAPTNVRKFWNDLFKKVSTDPEWVAHVKKSSIDPVLHTHTKFLSIIKKDMTEVRAWAKSAGILK